MLIEQAQELGEPPEDPLLLFAVLYGLWVANLVAFNGDVMRELAIQFSALAEKQSATAPADDRASPNGFVPPPYRGHRRRTSPSRSRDRALRSGRASRSCDTILRPRESARQSCPGDRLHRGCSAIPTPRSPTLSGRCSLRVRPTTLATLVYVMNFSIWSYIRCGDYTTAATLADEYDPLQNQSGGRRFGEDGGWCREAAY